MISGLSSPERVGKAFLHGPGVVVSADFPAEKLDWRN